MKTENLEGIICEHFGEMPDSIARHAGAPAYDLYFGPHGLDYWREEDGDDTREDYDFSASCAIVSAWLHDTFDRVWIDDDSGCISTREPDGEWYDPESGEWFDDEPDSEDYPEAYWSEPMPYWEIDYRAFCAAYVNCELISYL